MAKFLKQKVSPLLAFILIFVFGYFCIFWMQQTFYRYAMDQEIVAQFTKEQTVSPYMVAR